ncbi:MAG: hypothetical protein GXO77_04025, partial [Calditrichaeota bacterium]|nr:hypothetical protein [Calditrichota bacterium]
LRDQTGIFGNPTADSKRTSVDADTRNILAVFFTPPEVSASYLKKTLDTLIQYYEPICGRTERRILIFED